MLILAGLLPNADDNAFDLDRAANSERLVASCMTEAGFSYTPKNPHSLVDTADNTDFAGTTYAKEHGFGISAWPAFAPDKTNAQYTNSLSAADQKRFGDTLSTCSEKAEKQSRQDFGIEFANRRFDGIDGAVRSGAPYKQAADAWRACAGRAGYVSQDRASLIAALHAKYDTIIARITGAAELTPAQTAQRAQQDPLYRGFQQEEIRAAVATFPCSQQLDATYHDAFRHALQTNP
ncbi:hypothetical protein ABZ721_37155 [Streptomyces sp. NPDC006733]|uniref:hypothetical protein n=1 Tax=Streptomyces sp. NPDC006733 TaxID=3155460 RepID=UPI0033F76E96